MKGEEGTVAQRAPLRPLQPRYFVPAPLASRQTLCLVSLSNRQAEREVGSYYRRPKKINLGLQSFILVRNMFLNSFLLLRFSENGKLLIWFFFALISYVLHTSSIKRLRFGADE